MGKIIYLEDLKTILNNGVILHRWNDNTEDFDILYKTEVFEHNNENLGDNGFESVVLRKEIRYLKNNDNLDISSSLPIATY